MAPRHGQGFSPQRAASLSSFHWQLLKNPSTKTRRKWLWHSNWQSVGAFHFSTELHWIMIWRVSTPGISAQKVSCCLSTCFGSYSFNWALNIALLVTCNTNAASINNGRTGGYRHFHAATVPHPIKPVVSNYNSRTPHESSMSSFTSEHKFIQGIISSFS